MQSCRINPHPTVFYQQQPIRGTQILKQETATSAAISLEGYRPSVNYSKHSAVRVSGPITHPGCIS